MYRILMTLALWGCLLLTACSYGQIEDLYIRPSVQTTSQVSIEAIKADFDSVKTSLDAWALSNRYSSIDCYPTSGSAKPLCHAYAHSRKKGPAIRLTLEYSPKFNMDKLSIECMGSGAAVTNACNSACESINSVLASRFGDGSVMDYRMNESYGKDNGKMQLFKASC